jgi:imidazolonepropionase
VTAATLGGAAALGHSGRKGALEVGAAADIVAWEAEHEGAFALNLGAVRPARIFVSGQAVST